MGVSKVLDFAGGWVRNSQPAVVDHGHDPVVVDDPSNVHGDVPVFVALTDPVCFVQETALVFRDLNDHAPHRSGLMAASMRSQSSRCASGYGLTARPRDLARKSSATGFQEWYYELLPADGWNEDDIQERETGECLEVMNAWRDADRPPTSRSLPP